MLDQVLKIIEDRRQRSVEELRAFLAIPSISTDAAHAGDVQRCAQYLVQRLTGIGLSARIEPTDGLPVVLAHNEHQPDRPTILFYAHFDVQPPEPLDQWKSPPFEPTVRDGAIYARGAADDKGQLWAHLEAIAAWQKSGGLPVNVILLLESEEEIGSANLAAFMCKHRKELAADLAVISDTGQFARDIPAITYATRGLVYLDVTLTGANHDLHSGLHGGAVPNAANALVKLLSTLHLEDGRVNIPGFYDDVAPLSEAEREAWRKLPHDDVAYAAGLGIKPDQLTGERGYSSIERRWGRPTCDINGLTAGYQGPGAKTVIGSTASAKVSCRIVPNQNPHRIAEALERALRDRCDPSVSIEIHVHSLADAGITPRDGQAVTLASEAIRIGFGTSPALIRSGGTLPIVAMLASELSLETVMVGFSRPDDRLHSPNEKFDLGALYHGTRTAAVLYERLSQLKRS